MSKFILRGIKQKKSSWGSAINNKKWYILIYIEIGLLPLIILVLHSCTFTGGKTWKKLFLLASWLQPFVQASFVSSFPCHAPQRIQHEDLHSLIILTKTIAFWIIWHHYRVCTLLISSNPMTFFMTTSLGYFWPYSVQQTQTLLSNKMGVIRAA